MNTQQQENLTNAGTLRADILGSEQVKVPRRQELLDWLDSFIERAKGADYELGSTEAADLAAVGKLLRRWHVPVSGMIQPVPIG